MSNDELLKNIVKRVESSVRVYLSVDVDPDYNKAYADGMSDAFKALQNAGVVGLGDLSEMITTIFHEVQKINGETKGWVH